MKAPAPSPAPAHAELTLVDLAELPPRGSVAIAVRCAERLACFFRLPGDFEDREACQSIYDAALARARAYAAGGVDAGDRLQELIDAAYQMAAATAQPTKYTGYAVAHAIQAVGHAREIDDGKKSGMRAMQLVASTFGACRVLIQRGGSMGTNVCDAAVRADLTAMKEIPVTPGVDPSEAGPLGRYWPDGVPFGFS
jgi:hypothetical protein